MQNGAISHFHALLEEMTSSDLLEMKENFLKDLSLRKASYGGRLLTHYLRPKFISREQMRTMRFVCTNLRNIVVKVKDAFFKDEGIARDIGLTDAERELVDIDPGFSRICVTSRWDSFWDEESLKFVELNAECPAGLAYTDIMSQIYLDLPVMRKFMQKFRVESFHLREILLHALLATYQNWRGKEGERLVPNIAIVDWKEVPTYTEFELLQEYFEFHGVPTIIADPRELEYRNGRLSFGDFDIDLIYRRVLTLEFIQKLDEVQPMLQAYRDGKVCMINSFRSKMVHKKSLFAVLSDTENAGYFSPLEQEILSRHIPWTRIVRETTTDFHGQRIDLLDYIAKNKNQFVIKPNDEYGGKGVVLGWETPTDQWEKDIRNALKDHFVVQEKVPLAKESFPYYDDGLKFAELLVDFDPYLFGVNTAGCLTRLSSSSLANVTAGGGATVTFIVEDDSTHHLNSQKPGK